MKHNNSKNQKGFTLVELMIVVAVISILAMIGMTQYFSYRQRARCGEAELAAMDVLLAAEKARAERGVNVATTTVPYNTGDHIIQMASGNANSGVMVTIPNNIRIQYTQVNARTIRVNATRQSPACPLGDGTYEITTGQRQGVW